MIPLLILTLIPVIKTVQFIN